MAVDNGDRMVQEPPQPQQRLAFYSVVAIIAILIGLIFQGMWIVLMALGPGSHIGPKVFYLPPSVFPIFFLIAGFVLLGFHWREVSSAGTDPQFAGQQPAGTRFHRARKGFGALPARHKAHTVTSSGLALIMVVSMAFTFVLLVENWTAQRAPSGSRTTVDR